MGNRREFLIASLLAATSLAADQGEVRYAMFGMIAKLTSTNGRRSELARILAAGTSQMRGCIRYVISEDAVEENSVWVTEYWNSKADHDASLTVPAVQATVAKAKPLITGFTKIAELNPVAGLDGHR